jgi:tetraacyldisaccharide 4'-kinase
MAALLALPALLFEAAVRARNSLYTSGLRRPARLPRPVVSIGNLTMGGAGKTPFVIHVAGRLVALGAVPAILSRGYGRERPRSLHVVPPGGEPPDAGVIGDEPALIRRRVPSAWLGIAGDRHAAGRAIAARARNPLFVLDDGFQHRRLHRDLDILVVDRSQPFANNGLIPIGTLREPLSAATRAHVLVLHGRPLAGEADVEDTLRRLHPDAVVLHAAHGVGAFVPYDRWKAGAAQGVRAPDVPVFVAAAVGNPERLHGDLEAAGATVAGARYFRDHHRITPLEWRDCIGEAQRAGAEAVIVTEKDAVKLDHPSDLPVLVAVQTTSVAEAADLDRLLAKLVQDVR